MARLVRSSALMKRAASGLRRRFNRSISVRFRNDLKMPLQFLLLTPR